MRVKRIHHVTIAVRDIERALTTFEDIFGVTTDTITTVPAFGVDVGDLRLGDDVLQVASPIETDNPVHRFLLRKGEGFYNLAVEVEDLNEAIDELARRGVRVSEPVEAQPGMRSAFVSAAATHGLSIQLLEVIESKTGGSRDAKAASAGGGDAVVHERTTEAAPPRKALDLTPDDWADVD